MSKRKWILYIASALVVAAIAAAVLRPIRWRIHLVALKASSQIQDLSWGELAHLMARHGGLDSVAIFKTKDPYSAIFAPEATPERVRQGRELFNQQCAPCHGEDAHGGMAPNLTTGEFRHGASDWALNRTITHGIPGTPMQASSLPVERVWQLVTFLKDSVARNAANNAGNNSAGVAIPELHATFDRIKAAAENPANWLTYSGTYNGQRHSHLSQIARSNVGRLRLRWIFQFPKFMRAIECTPLVSGHVMFVTLPPGDVWALDTRTGEKLWSYSYPVSIPVKNTPGHNRGVAILGNTVYLGTLNAHLVALNAQTGKLLWDTTVADNRDGYGITSAPLALGNEILVGVAGGDFGIRGFVDAYSPVDGKRLWRFYTIPGPGEPGHETWGGGDSWKRGGGSTWLTGTYDPDLDLIYWGIGNPGPDYQGDVRPGINLYTCSVVAIEAATGRLRWYYQFSPHDEHDWDSTQVPVLADAVFEGKSRKLLYFANRNGFFYILDRTTGKFLHAEAFAKQNWAAGFDSAGVPIEKPEGRPTVGGATIFPNSQGATNWWSPTYDATSNTMFVPTMEGSDVYKKGPAVTLDYGNYLGGIATFRPTWTAVRALDGATGHLHWEYRFPPRQPSIVMGGLLATDGGLVFGGDDSLLVALDAGKGKELWRFNTGVGIAAAPITYLTDGKQQVTLVAGMTVLTFSLDAN
jgi:alcohol dehydrogenase (cytochrome c)